MKKKIAVVILNWNGAEMMRRFLPSVVAYSDEAEVIVADNGSTDHSIEMLRKEFPSVSLILLDRNYGFAEGYNKALEQLEHPYALLLNSDVEVTEGWLKPLLDYMESHPNTAACQPKIRAQRHPSAFEHAGAAGGYMDSLGYPFCRGRIMDVVEEDNGQYDQVAQVFWATGAALMVRTDVYQQMGGLDGRFFAHMEEIDLCWRMRCRGWKLVCVPQSVVYHVGGATLNKSNPRKTYLNFRNNLLMIYKNASEKSLKTILRWRTWLDMTAMIQMLLTGKPKDAAAVWRARRDFHRMKPDFETCRKENLRQTVTADIPEMMKGSVLWQFYVKRHKTFADLTHGNTSLNISNEHHP